MVTFTVEILNGKLHFLCSVGAPLTWRAPVNHVDNCYFCVVNSFRYKEKNKHELIYPSVLSPIIPVPHSDEIHQTVVLPIDNVLQEPFHSLTPVH